MITTTKSERFILLLILLSLCSFVSAEDFDFNFYYPYDSTPENFTWIKTIAYVKAFDIYSRYAQNISWNENQKLIYNKHISKDNAILLFDPIVDTTEKGSVIFHATYSKEKVMSKLYHLQYRPDLLKEFASLSSNLIFTTLHKSFADLSPKDLKELKLSLLKMEYIKYLSAYQYSEALTILQKINYIDPDCLYFFEQKIRIFYELNNPQQVKRTLENAENKGLQISHALQGDYYYLMTDYKDARKSYQKALNIDKNNNNVRYSYIKALLQEEKHKKANIEALKFADYAPYDAMPLILAAQASVFNKPFKAKVYLSQALKIDSLDVRLIMLNYKKNANLETNEDNLKKYLLFLKELNNRFPQNPYIYQEYIHLFLSSGRSFDFLNLVDFNPENCVFSPVQKAAYTLLKMHSEISLDYDYILADYYNSNYLEMNSSLILALSLYKFKQLEHAAFFLDNVIQAYPDNFFILKFIIEVYRQNNSILAVKNFCEKVQKIDSYDPVSQFLKAALYEEEGRNLRDYYAREAEKAGFKNTTLYNKEKFQQFYFKILFQYIISYSSLTDLPRFSPSIVHDCDD